MEVIIMIVVFVGILTAIMHYSEEFSSKEDTSTAESSTVVAVVDEFYLELNDGLDEFNAFVKEKRKSLNEVDRKVRLEKAIAKQNKQIDKRLAKIRKKSAELDIKMAVFKK